MAVETGVIPQEECEDLIEQAQTDPYTSLRARPRSVVDRAVNNWANSYALVGRIGCRAASDWFGYDDTGEAPTEH